MTNLREGWTFRPVGRRYLLNVNQTLVRDPFLRLNRDVALNFSGTERRLWFLRLDAAISNDRASLPLCFDQRGPRR
jgi:hypothetical protein